MLNKYCFIYISFYISSVIRIFLIITPSLQLSLSGGERILIARSLLNRDFSLFQSRGIWCMDDLFYLERAGREFVFGRKEGEDSLTIRETETGGLRGRGGCEGGNKREYALSHQTEMVLNSGFRNNHHAKLEE